MIVFNGKEVLVHYHKGTSPYLLVTFGWSVQADPLRNYPLRSAVTSMGISCLGVTMHSNHYFLSDEMPAAIEVCRSFFAEEQPVISFGHSMGGYACLKYAGALGADCVLALAPQFSLDPDELELKSWRDRKYYNDSMHSHRILVNDRMKGMGIKRSDVPGQAYVVFDPKHYIDNHNARLIARTVPGTRLIRIWGAGHLLMNQAADNQRIVRMLASIAGDTGAEASRAVKQALRDMPNLVAKLIDAGSNKRPRLGAAAIISDRVRNHPEWERIYRQDNLAHRLVYRLQGKAHFAEAYALLLAYLDGQRTGTMQPGAAVRATAQDAARDRVPARECLLLSRYGTILAYDLKRHALRLVNKLDPAEGSLPLRLLGHGKQAALCVLLGDRRWFVALHGGRFTLHPFEAQSTMALQPRGAPRGMLSILDAENGFLSAERDGSVHTDATEPHFSQRFAAIPVGLDGGASSIAACLEALGRDVLEQLPAGLADVQHRPAAPLRPSSDQQLSSVAKLSARGIFDAGEAFPPHPLVRDEPAPPKPQATRRWWQLRRVS